MSFAFMFLVIVNTYYVLKNRKAPTKFYVLLVIVYSLGYFECEKKIVTASSSLLVLFLGIYKSAGPWCWIGKN